MKTNINLRVSFYTRDRKESKVELSPIMLRVSYGGGRINLGRLPLEVKPSFFKDGTVISDCPNATFLNKELEAVRAKIMVYAEELYKNNVLTLDRLRDVYNGKANPSLKTFGVVLREINLEHEMRFNSGLLSLSTLQRYQRFALEFTDFIKARYHRNDLLLSEMSRSILDEYRLFLECQCGYNHNTLIKHLRYIVNAMKYGEKKGYINVNPLLDVVYRENPVDRGFLSTEELRRLEKVVLNAHYSAVRDVFLFACYTGISYTDVYNLREKNITVMNGHPWMLFKRKKTNVQSQVFLLDKAIDLLNKYNSKRPVDGRLLPVFCNQVINRDLKDIAKLCGIEQRLTFHLARHTFATLSMTNGVSMETVSKTLGHSSLKTTQIYARILPKKMEIEMRQLNFCL